jgi:2-dehydro-3-deoxyglucarate aldolase/4-hydroxy-2-oxoheptanedioate aldolase
MGESLKDVIGRPGPRFGTYVAEFLSPGIGHILKSAGCEFVLLGMEHNGVTTETVRSVLRYMEAAGLPTIVHVPSHSPSEIARIGDLGAEGIMTPMTETAAQAAAALDAMKYPPQGRRGCGMPLGYERHGGDMAAQIAAANARTAYVPLVESAAGVRNADAIAALDGVDALWVGQLDLSISLGIPDRLDHPSFLEAARHVAEACRRHAKPAIILAADIEQAVPFQALGNDMMSFGEDALLLRDPLRDGIAGVRQRLGAGNDPAWL